MISLNRNQDESHESLLISDLKVAEILSVSRRTVWRMLTAGKLPQPVRVASCVRWRYADIKNWVEGLDQQR